MKRLLSVIILFAPLVLFFTPVLGEEKEKTEISDSVSVKDTTAKKRPAQMSESDDDSFHAADSVTLDGGVVRKETLEKPPPTQSDSLKEPETVQSDSLADSTLSTTDEIKTEIPEFDTVPRMLSISVKVNNIDPEEKFKMKVGDNISENHTAYFTLIASSVRAEFKYSAIKSIQRIKINFLGDSLVLDTAEFDKIVLSKWSFDPVGGEIRLLLKLPDIGWDCVLKGKELFKSEVPVVKFNGEKMPSRLSTKDMNLNINRKSPNKLTIGATVDLQQTDITLSCPDPLGPPEITSIEGGRGKIVLDEKRKIAYLDVTPRKSRIKAVIVTGVKYGQLTITDNTTNRITVGITTTGVDTVMLKTDRLFDARLTKRGFPPYRTAIETHYEDTTITIAWSPLEQQKIVLRSMALPGWGQRYSQRNIRWYIWPAAQGAAVAVTGIFALITHASYDNYKEYNSKYLSELDQKKRNEYFDKRERAAGVYRFARPATMVSLIAVGAVYGINIADAAFFSIGPDTKVALQPGPRSFALVLDF
ncbi:MAG: hypothetical protein GF401_14990 [Chitinivibrionales bacterium]|nr:hypothetical protein [Chitinivibrionales bacterium]